MDAQQALTEIGFSDLEARIYCELLMIAPATGYRLAQATGKAAANVYQALSSLEGKGAVAVDEGEVKSFRPVAPTELLAALHIRFSERQAAARAALEPLERPVQSDRVVQIKNPTQALTRARAMIESSREVVLFDLFPDQLAQLAPDLCRASGRGVQVAGITYSSECPADLICVQSPYRERAVENWPGSQMTLVTDAREFLVALFSTDGRELHHGMWSDSVYLSCLQHSGLGSELRLAAVLLSNAIPFESLSLPHLTPAGFRELVARRKAAPSAQAA
jgi:sugar-specific transcriptional regulator TrmB